MTTYNLTVSLQDVLQLSAPNCRVQIKLMHAGINGSSLVMPTARVEAITGDTGIVVIALPATDASSRYEVKINSESGHKMLDGYFAMPAADANLADIIVFSWQLGADVTAITNAVAEAAQSAADALQSETDAETAATAAAAALAAMPTNPLFPKQPWPLGAQLLPFALSPVVAATVANNIASISITGAGTVIAGSVMSKAFSTTLKQWLCALPDFSGVNSPSVDADLVSITTNIAGMMANTGPGATLNYSSGTGLQLIVQPGNHVSTVDAAYTANMPFLMVVTGSTGQLDIITPNGTFNNVTTLPSGSTAYGILELVSASGSHVLALGLSTNPSNVGSLTVPGDASRLR